MPAPGPADCDFGSGGSTPLAEFFLKIPAIFFALLLCGCASNWSKAGATDEDFRRDAYRCEVDAAPVQDGIVRVEMQKRCMRVKGWVER